MRTTDDPESIETQYTALAERAALVEGSGRGVIVGSGDRPVDMLNGLVTNDLAPLESGSAVFALVLTPRGRPIAEMRIVPADAVWLDTPLACLEPLLAHLGKYVPPRFARFDPAPEVDRLSVVGPRADDALNAATEKLGWTRSADGAAGSMEPLEVARLTGLSSESPVFVVRREAVEGPGYDLYARQDDLEAVRDGLRKAVRDVGGVVASASAYEIWRVERGVPAFGADFGPDNLPQETGLEARAISYEKGCYTGQEVVARIHYRGHVNRVLRGLSLPAPSSREDTLPEPGTQLYRSDRPAGSITTTVRSPRLGVISLGYVRREIEPDTRLALAPGAEELVLVHALPFTER